MAVETSSRRASASDSSVILSLVWDAAAAEVEDESADMAVDGRRKPVVCGGWTHRAAGASESELSGGLHETHCGRTFGRETAGKSEEGQ